MDSTTAPATADTPTSDQDATPEATPAPTPAERAAAGDRAGRLALGMPARADDTPPVDASAEPETEQSPPADEPPARGMAALRQLEKAQGQAAEARAELAKLRDEMREVRQQADLVERARKAKEADDPVEALRLLQRAGWDFKDLVQRAAEGKLKDPAPYADLPPELAQRLQGLEAAAKELEERKAAEARAAEEADSQREMEAQRAEDREVSRQVLEGLGEKAAVLSALGHGPDLLVQLAYNALDSGTDAKDLKLDKLARQAEEQAAGEIRAVLSSQAAVRALLADDAVRATITAALGAAGSGASDTPGQRSTGTGEADGPTSLPIDAATEVRSRSDGEPSAEERRRRLEEAGRAVLSRM